VGLSVWFWVAWALMFLGGEGYALFNRTPGDTLSEQVWYWLCGYRWAHPAAGTPGTGKRKPVSLGGGRAANLPIERRSAWTWRTFAVGVFLLWLFFHLTFGWFAG
jgi:hypothetical protein